jgi:hypothetical protein
MTNYLRDICYSSALFTVLITILVSACQAGDRPKDLVLSPIGIELRPKQTLAIMPHQSFLTPREFAILAGIEEDFLVLPNTINLDQKTTLDRTPSDRMIFRQDVDQRIRSLIKKILRKQGTKKPQTGKHVHFADAINDRIKRIDREISTLQKRLAKVIQKKKRVDLSFPLTRKNLLILKCESQVYGTTFPKVFASACDLIKAFLKR